MKKLLLLSLALSFTCITYAQSTATFAGMKIKKFGITASYDQDMIKNIGADYFIAVSKDGIDADIANVNFRSQDLYSMICENPAARVELTLQPFRGLKNIELNTGASIMFNRNDGSYYNFYYNNQSANYERINFSSYSHEAALDAALLYHHKFSFLHLYGGVGTNVGMTFAGNMRVNGYYTKENVENGTGVDGGEISESELVYFNESHRMKNLFHQRVFAQGAATIQLFGRLELGLEGRLGVGYRAAGGMFAPTELHSVGIIAKWMLK